MNAAHEGRLNELIHWWNKAFPNDPATPQSKMRGTSLLKLAEYNAGGYTRALTWLRNEAAKRIAATTVQIPVVEIVETVEVEEQVGMTEDYLNIQAFFDECLALYMERNMKYGDSWKVLSASSLANLIEMKANRAAKMGDLNAKSLDEAKDMANYAAMLALKLKDL